MWVCALMQRHVSGYLSNIPPIAASRRRGMSPGLAGAPALMLGGRALARFVRGGFGGSHNHDNQAQHACQRDFVCASVAHAQATGRSCDTCAWVGACGRWGGQDGY